MKPVFLLVFSAALATPQSSSTTYTKDLNGNRVEGPAIAASASGERTERSQTINGRQVPLERIVDRVVREDATGKVTERTREKFSPNGQLASTERVMIEENKLPGGGSTVRETTYRSDINGGLREAERRTTETLVQGSTTTASTVVDRPTINGSFETIEKRSAVSEGTPADLHTTESIYMRDLSGGFQETRRHVTTVSKGNDATKETIANYEPGVNGQLRLASQSEGTTTRRPDGTEVIETNVFAQTVAGNVQDSSGRMRVKEQEVVERRVNPDGSVVETLSVRRPTVSDPNRLGDLQKLSETVCKGKCQADPVKPAADSAKP